MKRIIKLSGFVLVIFILACILIKKSDLSLNDKMYVVSEEEDEIVTEESNEKNITIIDNEKDNLVSKGEPNKSITIYISGAVNNPGILTLSNDKRLNDAIEELGGLSEDADLNRVNLALKLEDEKHYIVPRIGEDITVEEIQEESLSESKTDDTKSNLVNINKATLEELDTLPGVGESTANKIVSYREENNLFKSIEEIKNVNGIGDKKYEEIRELISVNWKWPYNKV